LLAISPNTTACFGAAITLTANAGPNTSYIWNTGSPFSSLNITASLTTNYVVTANTTSNGVTCPSSNTVMLTVNPNPTVTATSTRTSICKGEKTIISGGGASSYTWNTNVTTNTIQVSPTISTYYSVQGADANDCVSSATVMIAVKPCTGIEEQTAGDNLIAIYPNPNNGDFMVTSDMPLELTLLNELGQIIREISLTELNELKQEIKGITNGIYFVSFVSENQQKINRKIVVLK